MTRENQIHSYCSLFVMASIAFLSALALLTQLTLKLRKVEALA
ncbi:MAG TPA: hypothetical protein VME86_08025 [Acidobacteriaceae bacterium]|nr:hypothetical protein [Acidobacteriaceae bacterium]